jgi:hypothetical protein
VFFGCFYRYHLAYQEQYQMFLFTSGYMEETTLRIGGPAEYLSRFLVQFYRAPWLGAFIIASLLTLLQRLTLAAASCTGKGEGWAPLTFIPSVFYWILLCDESYKPTGVVSLLLVLAAFRMSLSIRPAASRAVYSLLMIPLLYVLTGGTAAVFWALCVVGEMTGGGLRAWRRLGFIAGGALLLIASPLAAHGFFPQYPLSKLWTGADYYRYQTVFPFMLSALWMTVPAVVLCLRLSPSKGNLPVHGLQTCALVLAAIFGIPRMTDWKKEEVMEYDYYVRAGDWEHVTALADRKAPQSPLSVAFLNLALCKQGLMPERMFHYYQNGPEGLLPSFVRDFSLPMMAGELYYHLGFINTAQRFAFEAMEAIPDFQRSARGIKRLAETNLLNGQYEVAAKYLRLLQHTLYYRKWATETMACLHDEERIEANADWAWLRKYRTKTDFLFSEEEKDMMLGILLQQDLSNRPAYEYLMAYCLLTKDLEHFYQYYPMGESLGYRTMPRSYQEALIYIWGLMNDTTDNIPYPVSDEVKRRVNEYRRIYVNYPAAEPMLRGAFSGTYWYYLHFRK